MAYLAYMVTAVALIAGMIYLVMIGQGTWAFLLFLCLGSLSVKAMGGDSDKKGDGSK
jgi:hypothetical protein